MQPPAVSKGSRCTCLSVFISCVLWLNVGGWSKSNVAGRLKLKYTDISVQITKKRTDQPFFPSHKGIMMVHSSSTFTLPLYEAIYLLWRGTFQFSLISLQITDQAAFSALAKMRDAWGERGTPVEPAPEKWSQWAEEGIPSDWLDAGRADWKPEIPLHTMEQFFFLFWTCLFSNSISLGNSTTSYQPLPITKKITACTRLATILH